MTGIPLKTTAVLGAVAFVCCLGWASQAGKAKDPLLFPKDDFTLETKIVKTSAGEKKVVYRSYKHVPYVADPVDKDYESLNVSVPVKVDDAAVDATNAPILFAISVGGYMSVNNAGRGGAMGGPGGGPMGPPPAGAKPAGAFPAGGKMPGPPPGGMMGGPGGRDSGISSNRDLALAAGYVVVTPGCRGRDNKAADGTFYGKAPAVIVDLKAAVRYLRHNKGVMPGNTDRIVSTGVSAGGALSALLGASGESRLYDKYLNEIGAAAESDAIFASACFCPIADLEHADGAYEWMYGTLPARSGPVDQALSGELRKEFTAYQASLKLKGRDGFGLLSADNYAAYLLKYYMKPSAEKFLKGLNEEKRAEYLAKNKWLSWKDGRADFTFPDYVAHVGRMKGLPAFDQFDLKQAENILFGNRTADGRHFTEFSLRHTAGDPNAKLDADLPPIIEMMNPMHFIGLNNGGCAKYWWLRQGTSDNHTSQTVIANLAASLENRGKSVDIFLYWDAGHGADEDAEAFIAWMGDITGFAKHAAHGS